MTPLAIAFTPNYFVPAATMLKSLLDASEGSYHVICLVTEEIPQRMQDKLVRMGGGRLEFEYIPMKGRLQGIYIDPRYTEAASFRLLLPELLPKAVIRCRSSKRDRPLFISPTCATGRAAKSPIPTELM